MVKFIYLMWFVVLFDPQWLIASKTFSAVTKIPTVLFAVLLVIVIIRQPRSWFPPLLTFVLYTLALIPVAYNRGASMDVAKMLIAYLTLALGTLALLRNVSLSVPIVASQMMYAYLWWIAWGVASGLVRWHPAYRNYDSFGPLMVIGIGSCYYYGVATMVKKERRLAYFAALGCVVGLVSSFARGAVLSGALVMAWIWFRSKNKLATTAAAVVGLIGVVAAGLIVNGASGKRSETGNDFFTEMGTIFAKDDGTRSDREVLWNLATREFADHPVFGVGANNFGPYAAQRFQIGETGGGYDDNPERLYNRQLHSTYMQILCEYGVVGSAIFLWILFDFWRRNRALRRKESAQAWAERTGGRLELRALSLGLECAMLGFLSTAMFYNQIFDVHWFYSIIIINTLVYYHSRPAPRARLSIPVAA